MASAAVSEQDPSKVVKDPLASHLIPDMIEDRRYENEGRVMSYKKGKLLGKGGFAKVFSGTLLPSKHQYAIKIVAKCSLQKARAQQKLQTEIRIHKALRHANVVKFERVFDDASFYYIVMELCDFNSMSELLRRRKKLSEPEVRFYLAQIVESLQYLHSHLVIHRDLKLGNLFIDSKMCIKVGDFGLATHLTHPEERRKTICGTPNYIAPEILEGKTGHSFEVDVWSTGVILYTLLVGKPPFESKDVKSTYKRILANSYAFPDHTPVGADAKNLIRKMLQARPEQRPSLKHVAAHPFFTRPSAYMPATLPESALHECPRLVQMHDFVHSSAAYDMKEAAINENYFGTGHGKNQNVASSDRANNENDPNMMNRANMQENMLHSLKKDGGVEPVRSRSLKASSDAAAGGSRPTSSASAATALQLLSVASAPRPVSSSSARSQSTAPILSAAAVYSNKQPTNAAPAYGSERTTRSSAASSSTRPSSRGHFGHKFDIYVDSNTATAAAPTDAQSHMINKKRDAAATAQEEEAIERRASRGKALIGENLPSTQPAPMLGTGRQCSAVERKPRYEFEIDKINTEFEHVHLAEHARGIDSGKLVVTTPPAATAPKSRDAWAWQDNHDVFPVSQAVAPEKAHVATPAVAEAAAPAAESEPMCISTPQDQVTSSKDSRPLGTLETMHEMLNNSFSVVDGTAAAMAGRGRWSHDNINALTSTSSSAPVAKVWVVRYVDYTSKYGLGFLFNTGSAGVYFNDSTKIVLSADGTVFQYTERRRRDSSNASEHSSQKHLITCYPPELQKKVTLLKHFRNYLVDQQKNSARGSETDDAQGGVGNPGLIRDGVVSDGACATVKFGQSSTRYNSLEENNWQTRHCCGPPDSPLGMQLEDEEDDQDMPFLKKWVRTKHAILFRISNRTVQVVFYDRSEVLLSSEARMITYVSKQGARSEHSLDDVLQTGRLDIAKRLKYTKDIMHRLINTQSK